MENKTKDITNKRVATLQDFIRKANEKHKNRYDYTNVNYVSTYTYIEIICKEHGPFLQSPRQHLRGRGCRQCANVRISKLRTGIKLPQFTQIHRERLSVAGSGRKFTKEHLENLSKSQKELYLRMGEAHQLSKLKGKLHAQYGKHRSEETKEKQSTSMKRKWLEESYRNKNVSAVIKANKQSPNKPEKVLIKLLDKKFSFVGNGKLVINGFCPDFVDCAGKKKIIELYGDYWHNKPSWKERDLRREVAYKNAGYNLLVVWEHELKNLVELNKKIDNYERE